MAQIKRAYAQRTTNMAGAFLAASLAVMTKAVKDGKVDHQHVTTSPDIPWPARRVALCDTSIGFKSEPTITYPVKS